MADSAEPEIIFSDLTQDVLIDGHRFELCGEMGDGV